MIPDLHDVIDACYPPSEQALFIVFMHRNHTLSLASNVSGSTSGLIQKFSTPSLATDQNIVKVVCGQQFLLIQTSDSEIWISQRANSKVFSDSLFDNVEGEWKRVSLTTKLDVIEIGAGIGHCAMLTDSGDVYSFGKNKYGCLGVSDHVIDSHCAPTKVVVHSNPTLKWKHIFVKTYHMFLQCSEGNIYACGYQKVCFKFFNNKYRVED
jgi:alpha-tubulin suppressor-like RCC1 family protein